MAKKRYCGKGWKHEFDDGNYVIRLALNKKDVCALPEDARGSVYVDVWPERRPPEKKSDPTHTLIVNDFRHPPAQEDSSKDEEVF